MAKPSAATSSAKINPKLKPLATPIGGLSEDPKNLRKHSERNIKAICDSLSEHGQQKPIVVDKKGVIIAGNGTFVAAQRLGWDQLAVVEYDGKKARRYGVQDNRTAELAEWDLEALGTLLDEEADAVESLGFTETEYQKLSRLEAAAAEEILAKAPPPSAPLEGSAAPAVPSGVVVPPEGAAPSHVRMVQLFLNADNHPPFMDNLKALAKKYGTTTVTDTVLRAVEEAASAAGA